MTDPEFPKQAKTVTREELFRQVWSRPMSHLAKDYGLSDRGLAKICARMYVPCPPRGYWAKVEAGQKVVAYRLPPAREDTVRHMTIRPTPPPVAPPTLPPEVKAKVAAVRASAASLAVPQRLTRPHAVVAAWLEEHEDRKRRVREETNPYMENFLTWQEFTEGDRRRHRILDTFFKALEYHGVRVTQGRKSELLAHKDQETIQFQIREKQKQVRVSLSRDQQRYYSGATRQELHPTGRLVFAIKTYLPGGYQSEWLESAQEPLESLLPDIVATFISAFSALAEQSRLRAEAEHQRHLEYLKRQEEQRQRKRDNNRWRKFVDLAAQRRDSQIAREFLDAIRAGGPDPSSQVDDRSLEEWIAWAESRLAIGDPLKDGAGGVFAVIADVTDSTYP